jgi:hypothetical protein
MTSSRRPAAWEGSTIPGRCVRSVSTGTAETSRVARVARPGEGGQGVAEAALEWTYSGQSRGSSSMTMAKSTRVSGSPTRQ